MNDASSEPVSLGKSGADGSTGSTAGATPVGTPKGNGAKAEKPRPPRLILLTVGALLLSGVASVASAIGLQGQDAWLLKQFTKNNPAKGKKNHLSDAQLLDKVPGSQRTALIGAFVVLLAVCILAYAVYRGRYWSRWGVIGFWVLGTFSQTVIGINSVLIVAGDVPAAYKIPCFVAGLSYLAAVVLVNFGESTTYFNKNRPVRPAGAPPRRGLFGGLGGPRPAPAGRGMNAQARQTRTDTDRAAAADRSRAKRRATTVAADSVAKGADLARSRAKASKSRRTDV